MTKDVEGLEQAEAEPIHVFIDTAEYERLNFDFEHRMFAALEVQVRAERVVLHTTSVTAGEVRDHIGSKVRAAVSEHGKFKKKALVVRRECPDLFETPDANDLVARRLRSYEEFNRRLDVVVHEIDRVDVEAVFDRYFASEPPFGDGKKKHEFPDAFVLLSLEAWMAERQLECVLVSNDDDLRRFAEQSEFLEHVTQIGEVLSRIEEQDQDIRDLLQAVRGADSQLHEAIEDRFRELGFILMDQRGEVEGVTVRIIKVEDAWAVRAEVGRADLVLRVEVSYDAEVSYPDLDTASYDSEDKVLIPHFHVRATIGGVAAMNAHATVSYLQPSDFTLERLEVDADDVEVRVAQGVDWS